MTARGPTVQLLARYVETTDKYFWLRQAPGGDAFDDLRERVRAVYADLPPTAFMMLDPAVAGEEGGPEELLALLPDLPSEVAGMPVRRALEELAHSLRAAPAPPAPRRAQVERELEALDIPQIEAAIQWVAATLGFAFADDTTLQIDARVVADGIPLGGLTGQRLDGRPVCFVAVTGQEGPTLAEALIHEATHAIDMLCDSEESLVARLRHEPTSSHQLWHVPFFVASAQATRHFVDADHKDYGVTHGYYAKVPAEMSLLQERGVLDRIRSAPR